MGQEKQGVIRAVLDTNVLVSGLLFSGEIGRIIAGWKDGASVPLFSRETFDEFRRVLAYPKFSLTVQEIKALIEDDVLPFCEVIQVGEEIGGVCRDPADDKFLSCAVAAGAECLVSGDKDMLDLGRFRSMPILTVTDFLKKFE